MQEELSKIIAQNIKKLRKEKNVTLEELSKTSKVSVSMISKIENSKTLPSIATYLKIGSALGVSFGELIRDDKEETTISIVRESERYIISKRSYIGTPLAYKISKKGMEPFLFYYPPGKKFPKYLHENEEMIYVTKGILEFKYGTKIIILNQGDCAYFNGDIEHGAKALSEMGAEAIVIELTV